MALPRRFRFIFDLDEGRERRLLALLGMAVLLLLAGPSQLSPDGAEMFALVRAGAWGGDAVGQWPPLWPALVAALPWLLPEQAARLWTLCLAGVVAWPLHLSELLTYPQRYLSQQVPFTA